MVGNEIGLQKLLAEIIANTLERREAEIRNQQQIERLAALLKVEKKPLPRERKSAQ